MCRDSERECLEGTVCILAACRGEGVSGVRLDITKDGELLNGTIGGKPVDDNKLYTIATIDYLADGNDGMNPLVKCREQRVSSRSYFTWTVHGLCGAADKGRKEDYFSYGRKNYSKMIMNNEFTK